MSKDQERNQDGINMVVVKGSFLGQVCAPRLVAHASSNQNLIPVFDRQCSMRSFHPRGCEECQCFAFRTQAKNAVGFLIAFLQ